MTDIEHSEVQDETSQIEAVEKFDIAQLRKVAKFLGITAQRDWRAEDYVAAIKTKQEQNALSTYVFDNNTGPAPGHARLMLHRDPTPGHKNSPVQVGVNGRIIHIPRGIEVDVPLPFVEALKNAKTTYVRQVEMGNANAPMGIFRDEETVSYPFQVTAVTPGGKFENQHDARATSYVHRRAFYDMVGRWPTSGELAEATKARLFKNINLK